VRRSEFIPSCDVVGCFVHDVDTCRLRDVTA